MSVGAYWRESKKPAQYFRYFNGSVVYHVSLYLCSSRFLVRYFYKQLIDDPVLKKIAKGWKWCAMRGSETRCHCPRNRQLVYIKNIHATLHRLCLNCLWTTYWAIWGLGNVCYCLMNSNMAFSGFSLPRWKSFLSLFKKFLNKQSFPTSRAKKRADVIEAYCKKRPCASEWLYARHHCLKTTTKQRNVCTVLNLKSTCVQEFDVKIIHMDLHEMNSVVMS